MKWAVLLGTLLAVLSWAAGGTAGPIEGGFVREVRIEERSTFTIRSEMTFKANERACVILIGDHEPVVDLAIYVYDERNNLVAKDDSGGDYCAATWYPPREGRYRIELKNTGKVYNECYLVVK